MITLIATCALLAATSTPAGFTDNLDTAFANAEKNGKYVYACFSGSDWCGWCMKLEKEVFSDKTFIESVSKDYELVFIDSPRNKDVLSERAKTENPKLTQKYKIQGFPTALVFNSKGEKIATTGYRRGGATAYAGYLKEIRAGQHLDPVETAEAKAKRLMEAKWIKPYAERQEAILEKLNDDCGVFQREQMAKGMSEKDAREASKKFIPAAAVELEKLLKEVEALKVPEEMKALHEEQLASQRQLYEIVKEAADELKK